MKDTRNKEWQPLVDLYWITSTMHLEEKILSQSSIHQIVRPIRDMEMPEKIERAKALIEILETSAAEQEILERAAAPDIATA